MNEKRIKTPYGPLQLGGMRLESKRQNHLSAGKIVPGMKRSAFETAKEELYGIVQSDIPYLLPWEKIFQ